jgi:hypothetical protein
MTWSDHPDCRREDVAREVPLMGTMKRLHAVFLGILIAGSVGACTVHGRAAGTYHGPSAGVVVYDPPPSPPPRRHVVVRPGYVWIEGRYDYHGGRYVWRDGYYERERRGHVYRPGRWQRSGRGHVWVEGRWDARGSKQTRDRRRVHDHRR